MKEKRFAIVAIFILVCAAMIFFIFYSNRQTAKKQNKLPDLMLWAWEQPQDMRFLKDEAAGAAFYAGTITLRGGAVEFKPRRQPAVSDPKTPVMPVIRIENLDGSGTDLNSKIGDIARIISQNCLAQKAAACQIDYDASESEIPLYKKIISEVHKNLPPALPLSITALVSWCGQDSWLAEVPIDEAVPMFFRMGPGGEQIKKEPVANIFKEAKCQTSIGISTDEQLPEAEFLKNKRIYIFSPVSWDKRGLDGIMEKIRSGI